MQSSAAQGNGLVILPPKNSGMGPGVEPAELRLNYHSFGHVPMGDTVSHTFMLKNTDDQAITVKRMKPACGCTLPKLRYFQDGEYVEGKSSISRSEDILCIPVGVTAELEVIMDSQHVPITNVDKTVGVMLTTDSPNGYYLHVETHIFVEKPFTQNPSGINFKVAPLNGVALGSTELILNPGYDITLKDFAKLPAGLEAELHYEPMFGKQIWRLEARLLPTHKLGVWQESLFIDQADANGELLKPLEVRMRAQVVEDLICEPTRLAFAADTAAGLSITLRTLLQGHAFGIEELILPAEHQDLFALEFEAIAPDADGLAGAWLISMRCKPGVSIEQLTRGNLRAVLYDPQHPETSIEYVVHPPRN